MDVLKLRLIGGCD
jgi:hypothetical protein